MRCPNCIPGHPYTHPGTCDQCTRGAAGEDRGAFGMSGYSDSKDVRATLDAGVAGFILKSSVLADLGRAIRETLRE